MKEKLAIVGGLILIISACFGVFFYFDKEYAHADDMKKAMEVIKKVDTRLDYKILEDRLRVVKQNIWTIEDRYCPDKSIACSETKMPQTVREQYRDLQDEKKKLQTELEVLKIELAVGKKK